MNAEWVKHEKSSLHFNSNQKPELQKEKPAIASLRCPTILATPAPKRYGSKSEFLLHVGPFCYLVVDQWIHRRDIRPAYLSGSDPSLAQNPPLLNKHATKNVAAALPPIADNRDLDAYYAAGALAMAAALSHRRRKPQRQRAVPVG